MIPKPGHVFDPDDDETLPTFARSTFRPRMRPGWTPEQRIAWCEEQTARHAIVKTCHCGRALMEGEQIPHGLKHAENGRVRSAAGTVLQQKSEDARAALALIQSLIDEVK